jgi:hypothetical protein
MSDTPMQGALFEGAALRDIGMHRVLYGSTQNEWREAAYVWLRTLKHGQRVTSTDLIDAIGMPPSPNGVGAVMRAAATRGYLMPTDSYVQSPRPSCHAAIVRVWRAT